MASLDSLPPDQRAVLQLVLQRGRSYDEIARLLTIDRAAVRERALTALDALGPGTRVAPERRALITDYLLGQLPARVSEDTRDHLAESASGRAWARVVASELGALSNGPLPEIPVESVTRAPAEPEPPIAGPLAEEPETLVRPPRKSFRRAAREPKPPKAAPAPGTARKSFHRAPREPQPPKAAPAPGTARKSFHRAPREPQPPKAAPAPGTARKSFRRAPREPQPPTSPKPPKATRPTAARAQAGDRPPGQGGPSSRFGGAMLLGGGLIVVLVIVIVIVVVSGGSSSSSSSSGTPSASASTPAGSTTASTPSSTTGTTTTGAQVVAQVNLSSPTGAKKTAGVAVVVKQGASTGLVIRAQGMTANTSHDAYAVWLYNSPADNHILGFVNPGVKADGKLQTAGVLPTNASHFKQILVTLETQAKPKAPGKIVLQGALNIS